jgi:uncharacterized protein YaeQ
MALTSTLFRFTIALSDVDRSVYETLELRVACHPSESTPFLITRVIAYALNFQPGIQFSQGISSPEDAAIYVKDLTGLILLWIDIGSPSAKRLHKASKAARAVRVYTYRDPQIILDEAKGQEIYKASNIEIFSFSPKLINQLEQTIERDNHWALLHDGGELSLTVKERTITGDLTHRFLAES